MAMPGTPVGSAPTGGLPSPPSSAIFPSPVDSGATTGQQFTSAPGQESRQPVNPASDPGNFSAVWLNGMNFTTPNKDWRRRIADLRAEGEEQPEEDLDVPAFLRRQAD